MIVAKLTPKQQRFCDEYLVDLNATQAAIRAGYSERTANEQGARLLAKVSVKAHIDEQMAKIHSEKIADAEEVMKYLTSVLRGDSSAHVLARDEIGAERIISKPPDEKERLKAAELLGKRYSLFTDKVNVDGAIPVVISGDDGLED
jgi:phage terminase small subunit